MNMVIGGQRIRDIAGLKDRLKKGDRRTALEDVANKPYEFYELIADASDELSFVNANIPINDLGNNILVKMAGVATSGDTESFVRGNLQSLISWVNKYYSSIIKSSDIEAELYDEIELCNCFLIVIWANEIGLAIELHEILQFIKKKVRIESRITPGSSGEKIHSTADQSFAFAKKTVAATRDCYGYMENDTLYLTDRDGNKRTIITNNAVSFQLDGDGGIVYLKENQSGNGNNVIALSDEEYPTANAVAIAVKDFQFAYILEDRTIMTNIPFARGASADGILFKNVFVCKNLLLAITTDDRVFSSDHGILDMRHVKKATAGIDGKIAYLTQNGDVYIHDSEKCISRNALDIEYCKHGLVIRSQEYISLWCDGRMNVIAESVTLEMAVSDMGVIYRTNDRSVHIFEFSSIKGGK